MANDKINFIRPFGPSIAKIQIPEKIIFSLNEYVDKIIGDQKKSKLLDHGPNLAGNVKQEFIVEPDLLKSSGLLDFLGKYTSMWIEASDQKKITRFDVISCWIVRQFQAEYNPIHYHGGHISGVGYLKLPTNYGKPFQSTKKKNVNGNISFIHGSRMFNSSSNVNVEPKLGDFYLFPNYMMHTVYPFYGNEERRSISFNAKIDDGVYNVYGG
tara:strand:- start:57 stop:692 length:636 start_codon:yes stop_codon:yes gene_type:complete